MSVLIDLLRWGEGGTQTYARRVIPGLLRAIPDALLLAEPEVATTILPEGDLHHRTIPAPPGMGNPYRRAAFQRFSLPRILRDQGIRTYFLPAEISGLRRKDAPSVRVVRMLRNLLPFDEIERARFGWLHDGRFRFRLEILRRRAGAALSDSDHVIFVSEHSRDFVSNRVRIASHSVVYHPAPDSSRASTETLLDDGQQSALDESVVYVSPTDPYKRQLELIAGFESFWRDAGGQALSLSLIGPVRGSYGRKVSRAVQTSVAPIRIVGELPYAVVLARMREASVLAFPSTCECCPNVLLEYLAAGRPIVSSDAGPMREIAGEAAVYFDAKDPASIHSALRALLNDSAKASALSASATVRAARFNLQSTIESTAVVLGSR